MLPTKEAVKSNVKGEESTLSLKNQLVQFKVNCAKISDCCQKLNALTYAKHHNSQITPSVLFQHYSTIQVGQQYNVT